MQGSQNKRAMPTANSGACNTPVASPPPPRPRCHEKRSKGTSGPSGNSGIRFSRTEKQQIAPCTNASSENLAEMELNLITAATVQLKIGAGLPRLPSQRKVIPA